MSTTVAKWLVFGLSLLRLAVAPALVWFILEGRTTAALVGLGVAVVTDIADGWLARRFEVSSAAGAILDVAADAAVALAGLAGLVAVAVFPWWTVTVVVVVLGNFIVSSGRGGPQYDPIGRSYGAVLFGLLAVTLALPDPAVADLAVAARVTSSLTTVLGRWLASRTPEGRATRNSNQASRTIGDRCRGRDPAPIDTPDCDAVGPPDLGKDGNDADSIQEQLGRASDDRGVRSGDLSSDRCPPAWWTRRARSGRSPYPRARSWTGASAGAGRGRRISRPIDARRRLPGWPAAAIHPGHRRGGGGRVPRPRCSRPRRRRPCRRVGPSTAGTVVGTPR